MKHTKGMSQFVIFQVLLEVGETALGQWHSCLCLKLSEDTQIRLAGVRFGSGSGVLGPNLNLHLEVRFKPEVNTNLNIVFRFGRFGSGSNNVRYINS